MGSTKQTVSNLDDLICNAFCSVRMNLIFILILVAPVANGKAKEESSDDDSSDDEEEVKPAPKVEAAKPAAKKEESSSDEDSSDEEEEKKPGMYLLLSFSKIKIGIFSNHIFRTISLTFKMC